MSFSYLVNYFKIINNKGNRFKQILEIYCLEGLNVVV